MTGTPLVWYDEAGVIPASVWDTVANQRSDPVVKKITVDELRTKMQHRGLAVFKLIGPRGAPPFVKGIDLLTDIVNEQRMDAAAEAVVEERRFNADAERRGLVDRKMGRVRGGPRIEDHTREQLNNAVEQAAEIFGHKEFYKMLHAVDAYFERRYRERTGGKRWFARQDELED